MCSCGCNCGACEICYIVEPVADPVISPSSQTFYSALVVTITCETQNAVIYYTTDGTTPTASSAIYTGPFIIYGTATVKAIALLQLFSPSNVVSETFTNQLPSGTLYWGARPETMLTGPEVGTLLSSFETDPYRVYNFPASSTVNDYFYFWWPSVFGAPRSADGFRDNVTLSPIVMAEAPQGFNSGTQNGWYYKNLTVNGTPGKLWRSFYQLGGGGSFPIEVLPAIYRADTTDFTADTTVLTADYTS